MTALDFVQGFFVFEAVASLLADAAANIVLVLKGIILIAESSSTWKIVTGYYG
jgi:hypothetical protein